MGNSELNNPWRSLRPQNSYVNSSKDPESMTSYILQTSAVNSNVPFTLDNETRTWMRRRCASSDTDSEGVQPLVSAMSKDFLRANNALHGRGCRPDVQAVSDDAGQHPKHTGRSNETDSLPRSTTWTASGPATTFTRIASMP